MDSATLCFLEGFVLVRGPTILELIWFYRRGWRFLGYGTRAGLSGVMPLYERAGHVTYPRGYGGRLEIDRNEKL